jgi:regulator of protease activity HflC (stomatin/prohibitin superfamily)
MDLLYDIFPFIRKKIFIAIIIFFLVIFLLDTFVIINPGVRGVIVFLGQTQDKILDEGFYFKVPFMQKIVKIDVKTQVENVVADAASKDLQIVTSKVALNYHVDPEKVNYLWKSIGAKYKERIIDPSIQESVKAITARYTAEELITKRAEVREGIKSLLKERLANHYIIVDEFSIVDFDFSKAFNDAIEAKVTAEQQALAAKNKLEQVKYEAEQRITTAKAEAEAIKIQAEAIQRQGGEDYVKLKAIEKWNGVLPTYVLGNSIPFIQINK